MEATIRTATPGDVDAIVAFGSAVVPQYYTPILGQKAAHAQLAWWTPKRMAPAARAGRVHVAVTPDRGLAGVCETGELSDGPVIWKLYLATEHRGRSLGARLLDHAVA